jgi:hypothetical protein
MACENEPRPRFAEPKRPLFENPPPYAPCPPTPPLWPPPPPLPPCAPPPAAELAPPPPLEVDVLAATAPLDAPSTMTTMRSDRCGRIKHLEILVQPQALNLTPGIARFDARHINNRFSPISWNLVIGGHSTGARALYTWFQDRESDHSEPEISSTCRVFCCGLERPGRRRRSWDSRDPSERIAAPGGGNINE